MTQMTATTTHSDKGILLLTGKNYTMWAFWMKARLLEKGLWHVVNTSRTAESKQEECDAFDLLVSTSSESVFSRVLGATSAKDVCEKLRNSTRVRMRVLWLQLKTRFIVSKTEVDQRKITSTNSDYLLQCTTVLEEMRVQQVLHWLDCTLSLNV